MREDGTGDWFLKTTEVQQWLAGNHKTLYCPGIPGAGKTVLTSLLLNHLEATFSSNEVGIAGIFCDYKDRDAQSIPNLLEAYCSNSLSVGMTAISRLKSYTTGMLKEHHPTHQSL